MRWWWASREEIAGPRAEESKDEGFGCFGGDSGFVGEVEGLGGEELGVISWRGAECSDPLGGNEESFSASFEIVCGASSWYVRASWLALDNFSVLGSAAILEEDSLVDFGISFR